MNSWKLPFFTVLLSLITLIACEGPAGPQGLRGEDGQDGQGGPQGQAGPSARILNFTLQDQLKEAQIEADGLITSPILENTSYIWRAVFDTTIFEIALADTEVVFMYADLPGIGFTQLPLNIDFTRDPQSGNQRIAKLTNQLDDYSYQTQSFDLPNDPPAVSFGNPSKQVYGKAIFDGVQWNAILTFTLTDNQNVLNIRSVVNSSLGLDPDAPYAQALLNNDGVQLFPLDSNLSNSHRDDSISTDINGEFIYEASSNQLSELKDSLGADLDSVFHNNFWGLYRTANPNLPFVGFSLLKNPTQVNLQLFSQWGADSIRVTGRIEGLNEGDDITAYVNEIPINIRVIIVSGSAAGKRSNRIPYQQLMELIQ